MKSAYTVYKTADVDTADQGRLIIIAYDVAIKNCRLALQIFPEKEKTDERIKYLYKAQDAVGELMGSLRMDVGEIAQNLFKLYEYMLWRIIQAITKNNADGIQEILKYLVDLRDAWNDAIRICRAEKEGTDIMKNQSSVKVSG